MSLKNLVGRSYSCLVANANFGSKCGSIRQRRSLIILNNNCNDQNNITRPCRRSLHLTSTYSSQYPAFFLHPIYLEPDQQKIKETGEAEKLAFVPIRAAESDENQSCWHDPLVARFINMIMEDGNKMLARELLDKSFENIKRIQLEKYYSEKDETARAKIILNPWEIFHKAIHNCKPILETTPIKRGGTTYAVPVPVTDSKATYLALKWMIEASLEKEDDLRFHLKLAWELLDAANDTGRVVKKKQDLHKLCEANRAFAHFRWQ